eukprot:c21391_g2_i2.p1 GENE.c21391_g2_i2~~c21391_g2_i2.p1  ORF type:complete len:726 (-),score=237.71 c21391_g2_i2:45-2222(-)
MIVQNPAQFVLQEDHYFLFLDNMYVQLEYLLEGIHFSSFLFALFFSTSISLTTFSEHSSTITTLVLNNISPSITLDQLFAIDLPNLDVIVISGGVTGTIPKAIVRSAPEISFIYFGYSDMQGGLPKELADLSKLVHIEIGDCSFQSTIPSELGQLDQITHLALYQNHFSGSLPQQLYRLTNLLMLFVNENRNLAFELSSDILRFPRLEHLKVDLTISTGTIPTEIFSLTDLQTFAIDNTLISGTVPSEIGFGDQMHEFSLSGSKISGTIPTEVGLLTLVVKFGFANVRLSGTIPTEFGRCTSAEILYLKGNSLSGTVPTEIGSLTSLSVFITSNNIISGIIPQHLGQLTRLTFLDLSGNQISGSIPSEIGKFKYLKNLIISRNKLSGTLPSELSSIPLIYLDIQNNSFSGTIPESLINIVSCVSSGIPDNVCQPVIPKINDPYLNKSIFYALVALTILVELMIFTAFGLTIFYRNTSIVQATNPVFGLLSLLGLSVMSFAVIPYGLSMIDIPFDERERSCKAFPHLISHGVVIVFTCIAAKNYPILKIMTNGSLVQPQFTLKILMKPVIIALLVDVLLVTPMTVNLTAIQNDYGCENEDGALLLVKFLYLLVLALIAAYTAYGIRDAPAKFNDTPHIGAATYSTLTFGSVMIILAFTTTNPSSRFLSISLSILSSVTLFVYFLYGVRMKQAQVERKQSMNAIMPAQAASIQETRMGMGETRFAEL